MPCNIGWKFMTGLMVLEMVVSFISSFTWGLGFVGYAIKDLVDRKACLGPCLTSAQVTIDDIQMFACGLYAVTGLAAGLAIIGILSGQLWLQVPNVAVSFIRLVGSLVIGEYLIQVNMGRHVFTYNRVIMYFCLVVNFITFTCNFAQANREYKRKLMERNGMLEPQVRPLTNVFGSLFGTTATCCICTPPIIAEGLLPDIPEHVVEAAHHNDLLDGVVEANTPGPGMRIDVVNGRDLETVITKSCVTPEIGNERSGSVNMDDEILLDIEYGNESVRSK